MMNEVGETHCSRLSKHCHTHHFVRSFLLDRRADRFEPRYDPRGPDPRDYRGGAPVRDYGRPAPYDRYDR